MSHATQSNGDVFASLTEGDAIQFETSGKHNTESAHTVTGPGPSQVDGGGALLSIEGPGGATKLLTQNKHDEDAIYVMSMGSMSDSGTLIKNLRVVGGDQ